MKAYSYTLVVREYIDSCENSTLSLVASFSTPRKAYQFIDKHIKKLTPEELRSIDKGRGKDTRTVIYSFFGLTLEIVLYKNPINPDTMA